MAVAQETSAIKGRVIDKMTEMPLSKATISVEGTDIMTQSDYEGYYRLNRVPIGTAKVQVSYLGYETKINQVAVEVKKDAVLDMALNQSVNQLKEVVISNKNIYFKNASMYEADANAVEERNINGFYALEIFKDLVTAEIWGLGKTNMMNVFATDAVSYKGTHSLAVSWNKTADHTKWVGMGIGWDQWGGKNLTLVEENCGIRFYMRAQEGIVKNVIIVFHLEDYSGGQCSAVLEKGNFYGGEQLGEEWKEVIVPFYAFHHNRSEADFYNVKQLIMQFEGKASVYIDEMEIVELPEHLRKPTKK